jgi:molybdate transport system regulatory protein
MSNAVKERTTADRDLVPRVKVWLESDGQYAFGLGICEVLQAVERSGSIKQAARDVGKSYRHVWDRIKEAEQAGGSRLVETRVGGTGARRSCLTEEARVLVAGFLAFRTRMSQLAEREFTRHFPPAKAATEGNRRSHPCRLGHNRDCS